MGRKRTKPRSTSTSTRRTRSVKKEQQELSEEKLMFLENLEREFQNQLLIMEKKYNESVENVKNYYDLLCAKLGDKILNTRYYDLPTSEPQEVPAAESTRRRSKSCSSVFALPKAPQEKMSARTRSQDCLTTRFQTPANKGIPTISKIITPKITQDTPMTIMRRPRQGEWAVSMSGSPLMVSAVHENTVNISIPLEDGSVVSILPCHGLRRSDLPSNLPETTREQLEAISHNLNVILQD